MGCGLENATKCRPSINSNFEWCLRLQLRRFQEIENHFHPSQFHYRLEPSKATHYQSSEFIVIAGTSAPTYCCAWHMWNHPLSSADTHLDKGSNVCSDWLSPLFSIPLRWQTRRCRRKHTQLTQCTHYAVGSTPNAINFIIVNVCRSFSPIITKTTSMLCAFSVTVWFDYHRHPTADAEPTGGSNDPIRFMRIYVQR